MKRSFVVFGVMDLFLLLEFITYVVLLYVAQQLSKKFGDMLHINGDLYYEVQRLNAETDIGVNGLQIFNFYLDSYNSEIAYLNILVMCLILLRVGCFVFFRLERLALYIKICLIIVFGIIPCLLVVAVG